MILTKKFEILRELPKCYTKTESKYYWENGANRSAQQRVATNLQSAKNAVSAKRNKMRHACTRFLPKRSFQT